MPYNLSQYLQDATKGPMAKLGSFIREHPEYLVENEDNIGEKIFQQNLAYVKVKIFFIAFLCNYDRLFFLKLYD